LIAVPRQIKKQKSKKQFFGGPQKFLKKAAPILKRVAKVATPIVGTAIHRRSVRHCAGKLASKALGEGEFEDKFEILIQSPFQAT
jgi:hypothetical protein